MAVLGRLLLSSSERLDMPDLKAIDSYVMGDFKYLMESFVGANTPYILKGFDVTNPRLAIGTNSLTINVADSIVFCPTSTAGPFFVGLEAGNPLSTPLVPDLQFPAGIGTLINYIYIVLTTVDGVSDTRAFWDKNLNAQAGGEFAQIVDTETYLIAEAGVSTSGFPTGSIPICQVQVSSTVIDWIKDCRYMLFRLGSGGLNPDIYSEYDFRSLPTIGNERTEQPITVNGGSAVTDNPFQGADKNIYSLKEWMDVVMTKLKELGGTSFWYQYAGGSILNLFNDTLGTVYQSKGTWSHSVSIPGRVSWSEDIKITSVIDPRVYVVEQYLNLDLDNEQIAYLNLIRDSIININNFDLIWTNAQKYVNSQVGAFTGLEFGDWIKPANAPNNEYVRIEEFYTQVNLGGVTCIPSIAKSVKIANSYEIMTVPVLGGGYINGFIGATQTTPGQYSKGRYAAADIDVIQRNDLPTGVSVALGLGDGFSWLAYRSDIIENVGSISTRTLTCDITPINPTSSRVSVTASIPVVDTLISGMVITISAGTHAGTYTIEVEDATHFIISSTGITEVGTSAYYAMVTTAARSNPDSTIVEESANHRFEDYGLVIIDSTTDYDGTYRIKDYSTTSFTIPVASALPIDNAGYAIQANVNVRMESGVERLVQGQSKEIGETEAENIMEYVGQPDNEVTVPVYLVPKPNDYLDGQTNYDNPAKDDNLTRRIARLTAMMADKAQDKTIESLISGVTSVNNTAGVLTFIGGTQLLTIVEPTSLANGTIDLNIAFTIGTNQAIYYTIDRNATAPYVITPSAATDIDGIPLDDCNFILAYRLSGTDIYLWDGTQIPLGNVIYPIYSLSTITMQNNNSHLIDGGLWTWTLGTQVLAWDAIAYIQVPGLANTANQISIGNVTLTAGQLAYVDINRSGAGGIITPSVAAVAGYVDSPDRCVFARRIDNDVVVGLHSLRIKNHEGVYLDDADYLVNDSRFKCVPNDTNDKSAYIYPSKRISNGKEIYSYILGNISSKFPRNALGQYNGGANHDNSTRIDFQHGGVNGDVWVTFPGIAAFSLATLTIDPAVGPKFKPVSIFVNADDSISISEGGSYSMFSDPLGVLGASDDNNIPLGGSSQFKVATVIITTDSGIIRDIAVTDIIDRRAFGGGGGGSGDIDREDMIYISLLQNSVYTKTFYDKFDFSGYYVDPTTTAVKTLILDPADYFSEVVYRGSNPAEFLLTKNIMVNNVGPTITYNQFYVHIEKDDTLETWKGNLYSVYRERSANIATITTTIAHGLEVGDTVIISGLGGVSYNGTHIVTGAPTSTTFTYANAAANETPKVVDTGGLIIHSITNYLKLEYNTGLGWFEIPLFKIIETGAYSFGTFGATLYFKFTWVGTATGDINSWGMFYNSSYINVGANSATKLFYAYTLTGAHGAGVPWNVGSTYTNDGKSLEVYKNGYLLKIGTDYQELSSLQVSFTDPLVALPVSDKLIFRENFGPFSSDAGVLPLITGLDNRVSNLENKLDELFVGSTVAPGWYATIPLALIAVAPNQRIIVTQDQNISAQLDLTDSGGGTGTLTDPYTLEFKDGVGIICDTAVSGAATSVIKIGSYIKTVNFKLTLTHGGSTTTDNAIELAGDYSYNENMKIILNSIDSTGILDYGYDIRLGRVFNSIDGSLEVVSGTINNVINDESTTYSNDVSIKVEN